MSSGKDSTLKDNEYRSINAQKVSSTIMTIVTTICPCVCTPTALNENLETCLTAMTSSYALYVGSCGCWAVQTSSEEGIVDQTLH